MKNKVFHAKKLKVFTQRKISEQRGLCLFAYFKTFREILLRENFQADEGDCHSPPPTHNIFSGPVTKKKLQLGNVSFQGNTD